MDEALHHLFSQLHWTLLGLAILVILAVLGKAADWLVGEAVALSERSGVPKSIIGATIVSLGTTTPEVAVSVLAALKGSPGLALGNAVGSVICDTGLILGLISVMSPLRLDRRIVNRQGWVQLGAAAALVAASFPWRSPEGVLSVGGRLPQVAGFAFLAGLAAYLWQSARWIERERVSEDALLEEFEQDVAAPLPAIVAKLLGGLALVVLSAQALIPAVIEAAARLHVPESIIAGTVVAFGTSLPELVTAIAATRHGHGELAVGTVIGADILNVLFVAGAAAAVTPAGLHADGHFFVVLYPIMLFVLIVFRLGVIFSGDSLKRPFGILMLLAYCLYVAVSFWAPGRLPAG
ncbi:MAG TPA: sodium:calcium antiporter [Bryobacterales bacterium]|nr:sodium:calcium antiporter [Bryobacterales bacterium]